jgi:hypothetical protein
MSEAMEGKPVLDLWPFSAFGLAYQTYPCCLRRSPFGLRTTGPEMPNPIYKPNRSSITAMFRVECRLGSALIQGNLTPRGEHARKGLSLLLWLIVHRLLA